jgi:hypothetical protein
MAKRVKSVDLKKLRTLIRRVSTSISAFSDVFDAVDNRDEDKALNKDSIRSSFDESKDLNKK